MTISQRGRGWFLAWDKVPGCKSFFIGKAEGQKQKLSGPIEGGFNQNVTDMHKLKAVWLNFSLKRHINQVCMHVLLYIFIIIVCMTSWCLKATFLFT